MVTDNILNNVKDSLDISDTENGFDSQLNILIAGAIQTYEHACRYEFIFSYNKESKWSDIKIPNQDLELLKQYVYIEVRIQFDPPQPTTLTAHKELAKDILLRAAIVTDDAPKGGDSNV